jgi:hypothetical protein
MVKTEMFKRNDGALLVIKETLNEDLIGEVYADGVEKCGKRGSWDMRATFKHKDNEAEVHRVLEYFGFTKDNSVHWWSRWGTKIWNN